MGDPLPGLAVIQRLTDDEKQHLLCRKQTALLGLPTVIERPEVDPFAKEEALDDVHPDADAFPEDYCLDTDEL